MPSNLESQNWDAKLAELHDRLITSVEVLVAGNEWQQALEFAARFRTRSFNNAILIWTQHAAAYERGVVAVASPTFVAGFRQWQTLGRTVAAGQKGYMIFAPVTARFASYNPSDLGSWRRLNRSERPRTGEIVRPRMVGTRPAYVWDISQTDGSPIPELPVPTLLNGDAPQGLWDGLASLIQESDFRLVSVETASSIGGANGLTDFISRTVSVREDMEPAARTKTLAHELAHIRMHEPDVNTLAHRGLVEVEAESVALMIGAAHGMDTSSYTIPYVSTWAAAIADKEVVEVVQATGERVRRAAVSILDQLPTLQIGGDVVALDRSSPTRNRLTTMQPGPGRPATRFEIRSL